jgi:ribosomal protein S18 acetylase RimI-like enzyme
MRASEHGLSLGFRQADPSDVEAVVALVHSAYRGDASREGWTTEADLLDGQRTDVAAVREMVDQAASVVLLAVAEDSIVGCCHLVAGESSTAHFGMFAVRPALQAGGLGAALLAEAERTVRARWGFASIRLNVLRQRDELIGWYRRRGFEPTGETEPFPYGDERFGVPLRADLEFVVLQKSTY